MKIKNNHSYMFYCVLVLFVFSSTTVLAEMPNKGNPWEKAGVNLGGFLSSLDSSFRIGNGVGLNINVEKLLDLDSSSTVFRGDFLWRFTKNRKHRADFSWFSFRRDGSRILFEDVTIGNGDNEVVILKGTSVDGFFDLDIYQLFYSYSFLQDDRIDLAVGAGVYIMPIKFGLNDHNSPTKGGSAKFTAPLPVLGLRIDVALTPKWFLRSGSQIFYVEYGNFKGSLLEFRGAVEYKPWKHIGFGLGFDAFGLNVKAEEEDWPSIDLNGEVELNYAGVQLYFRYFF